MATVGAGAGSAALRSAFKSALASAALASVFLDENGHQLEPVSALATGAAVAGAGAGAAAVAGAAGLAPAAGLAVIKEAAAESALEPASAAPKEMMEACVLFALISRPWRAVAVAVTVEAAQG